MRGHLNRPAPGSRLPCPSRLLAGLPDQEAQLNNGPARVVGGGRRLLQPAMIHPLAPGGSRQVREHSRTSWTQKYPTSFSIRPLKSDVRFYSNFPMWQMFLDLEILGMANIGPFLPLHLRSLPTSL